MQIMMIMTWILTLTVKLLMKKGIQMTNKNSNIRTSSNGIAGTIVTGMIPHAMTIAVYSMKMLIHGILRRSTVMAIGWMMITTTFRRT